MTRGRRPRRAGRPPWALIGVGGLAALVLLIVLLLSGDRGGETANTNPGGGQPSRTPITDQRDARSSPADAGAQVSGGKPTPPPPAVVRPAEAGDPVNLLAGIDLSQHAVRGGWRRDRAVLVSPRDTPALLQVPCNVPAAYEVEAEVLQSAGDGSLGLFLVGEGRQFLVLFDSDSLQGGVASGVQFIDGYHCTADGNPTRRFGDCFAFGEPTTLRCVVRPGSVEAFRNGKAWVQFQGDFHRLSIPAGKPNMPSLSLGILTWGCEFRISRLQLRPLPAP